MNSSLNKATQYSFATLTFMLFALIAFSANSVLARLALIDNNIDPLSFTSLRLLSGAIMLAILVIITSASKNKAVESRHLTAAPYRQYFCLSMLCAFRLPTFPLVPELAH